MFEDYLKEIRKYQKMVIADKKKIMIEFKWTIFFLYLSGFIGFFVIKGDSWKR